MATASQFAAPRDSEASFRSADHVTPLDPPAAHEGGDSFALRSPPGPARPHSDLRITSPRWTRQQPPKVATVSLLAAPQGRRGLILICPRSQ